MTETVNRNAKNVCILVMLVINIVSDRALVGLSSKLNIRLIAVGIHLIYFGSITSQSPVLCIFREDRHRVLRGPQLGGAPLQPHLPQARGPGPSCALVQE